LNVVTKKSLFLFLGLLLPVLVFLFLKFFGRNEFDVPLPEREMIQSTSGCRHEYAHPYLVKDSLVLAIAPAKRELRLINFGTNKKTLEQALVDYNSQVSLVNLEKWELSDDQKTYLFNCVLLATNDEDLVLLDNANRIRGYYNSSERDDMDRLEAELNILLKRY
jgi:hypothetical protein